MKLCYSNGETKMDSVGQRDSNNTESENAFNRELHMKSNNGSTTSYHKCIITSSPQQPNTSEFNSLITLSHQYKHMENIIQIKTTTVQLWDFTHKKIREKHSTGVHFWYSFPLSWNFFILSEYYCCVEGWNSALWAFVVFGSFFFW